MNVVMPDISKKVVPELKPAVKGDFRFGAFNQAWSFSRYRQP